MNPAQVTTDLGDGWQGLEVQSGEGTRMLFGQSVVHRFSATELRALKMDLSLGDVSIKAGNVDSIVVTVQSQWATADLAGAKEVASGVSPVVETAQSGLQWSDGWSSLPNPALLAGVEYRVEVPESMETEIRTLDGSITIAGIGGNASVEANGRIVIGQMGGAIEARSNGGNITMVSGNDQKADLLTIGGDIWVANSGGGVRARASDGDVYLGRSTGNLFAQVSGGDIYVSEIGGPAGGHTSGGNVYMLLNDSPAGDSNFSSAGGSVFVRVREGIAGTIQTRAPLQSTLEFQELPSTQGGKPFSQCDLNGGGALLQYVCSSGVLNIEFTDPNSKGDARLTGLDPLGAGASAAASGGKGQAASKGLLDPAESSESARGLGGSTATSKGHASSAKGLDSSPGGEGSASGPSTGGGLSGSGVASGPASGPSLGGSGSASGQASPGLSAVALERTSGAPRAGALATVLLENPVGNIDGYTLYLPRSFDERDGPFPILVYLQGAYGVGGRVSDLNNWGLARLLRDETDMGLERNRLLLDEFIVVSLHIQSGDYHEHPTIVDDILKRMVTQYKGDADRISVTGLSRGGHGTWGMAAELPGRFAAIAPVGGHAGDMDDFKKVQNTAVWIAHNRDDITVRFENADQAMKQIEGITGKSFTELTPAQVPTSDYLSQQFLLTSSANGGHDAWTDLYTSAEFYKWLLAQKRAVEAE
ncbi:MAG: hypothetical protein P1V35_05010 [Planctomycetota bacterium]|nr:hypothetical protein [Planctomycetota bacterium]